MVSGISSDKLKDYGAMGAGLAVGAAVPVSVFYGSTRSSSSDIKAVAEDMQKTFPAADTFEHVKANAEKVLDEKGLRAKGVKVFFVENTQESLDKLSELCSSEAGASKHLGDTYFETFKNGANAAFFPNNNVCIAHSEHLYDNIFHELGHAMNKNGNILTKAIFAARMLTPAGASIVAPIALATGVIHKVDKTKPKEQKGFFEKTKDFVANHAVALTALSYFPLLADEGLASIRGLKAVKPHVSKDVLSKISKNYKKAWGEYAQVAAAVTAGVAGGVALSKFLRKDKSIKEG